MGCDIEVFIEYFPKNVSKFSPNYSICFCKNVFFGRNYDLFSLMSSVTRGSYSPLYKPTGFDTISPKLSYECQREFYIHILNDDDYNLYLNGHLLSGHKIVMSKEKAKTYIDNNSIIMISDCLARQTSDFGETILDINQLMEIRKEYLFNCFKYENSINSSKILKFIDNQSAKELMNFHFGENEYTSLYTSIKMMQSIEHDGENKSRLVCWFNN